MDLIIHKPYIKKRCDKTQMLSNIEFPNGTSYELFYEVEQKWEEYLTPELSDSFVCCFLLY